MVFYYNLFDGVSEKKKKKIVGGLNESCIILNIENKIQRISIHLNKVLSGLQQNSCVPK